MTGQRRATRKDAEKFMAEAFADSMLAKAGLIVVHRFVRAVDATPGAYSSMSIAQQQAYDQMDDFARLHPLPPMLERLL